jgi:hypothetical protein
VARYRFRRNQSANQRKEKMKDELLYIAIGAFLIGAVASTLTIYATHRQYQNIIKTNIGEFMLRDNKVYGVYEMTRDVQGNMVSK